MSSVYHYAFDVKLFILRVTYLILSNRKGVDNLADVCSYVAINGKQTILHRTFDCSMEKNRSVIDKT